MGFIAASIGSGLVYSVQLYRNSQSMDILMPQLDTACNVIRKVARQSESMDVINSKLVFSQPENKLYINNELLLSNVLYFSISEEKAFSFATSNQVVRHITLQLDITGNQHSLSFDVCPQ